MEVTYDPIHLPYDSSYQMEQADHWRRVRAKSYELNKSRSDALNEVDNASFSRFHLRVCMVAGVGFFIDAYDIFSISIVSTMLSYVYNNGNSQLDSTQDLLIKIATPIGTFIGQLLFGWLGDVYGRKKMYGTEITIILIGTLAQAVAGTGSAVNIIRVLFLWRLVTGIGIGGDYPLSAIITSEFAPVHIRGRLMSVVFAKQGWGQLAAAVVALGAISASKRSLQENDVHTVDVLWRIIVGLGCVPSAIALYMRLTIPETPRFTMDIERNVEQAVQDVENFLTAGKFFNDPDATIQHVNAPKASFADFREYFSDWDNLKTLIGVCYSWLALDTAFYGLTLNNNIVLQAIRLGPAVDWFDNLYQLSISNMIIILGGAIPGYWVSFLLIDRIGRKPIQYLGFTMLTILFVIMSTAYKPLTENQHSEKIFVVLYCAANFFQNFGPNTTTFIIPAELFPSRYRSTVYGIVAACGKLGAILVQIGFSSVDVSSSSDSDSQVDHSKLQKIIGVLAIVMCSGIASTYLIPETNQKSLEELSNEDQGEYIIGLAQPRVVLE
ncbi:major facilitator superfamily domain-containing protein [Abortiporus biennis]|nr:major facilitator superfamily domain-containing protein [Abortiporus biennis]